MLGILLFTSLTNADGAYAKIALVNFADSSVTDLAGKENLWHLLHGLIHRYIE